MLDYLNEMLDLAEGKKKKAKAKKFTKLDVKEEDKPKFNKLVGKFIHKMHNEPSESRGMTDFKYFYKNFKKAAKEKGQEIDDKKLKAKAHQQVVAVAIQLAGEKMGYVKKSE